MQIEEFKRKAKRVFSMRFVRDLMVMQTGSFFSTSLSAIASIVYARVLGVESYAVYALIFAFVGLCGIFMNVGAGMTVLTLMSEAYAKKDREEIKNLGGYFFHVGLLIFMVIGISLLVIAPAITGWFYHRSDIGQLTRVIILANGLNIVWNFYTIVLQVIRRIKRLTVIENVNSVVTFIFNVLVVIVGYGVAGIVWAYLISSILFFIYAILAYWRLEKQESLLPPISQMLFAWNQNRFVYYFKFGFLIAIDKNIGSLYSTIPIFLLGRFNISYVAYLKVASSFAQIPLMLIGPVSRLLMVQLPQSKIYSYVILKRDYIRSTVGSVLICLVLAVPLAIIAPYLITLVYGDNFLPAVYLSWPMLAGTVFVAFGVGDGPIYRTLHILKKAILINSLVIIIGTIVIYSFIRYLPTYWSIFPIAAFLPTASVLTFSYAFFRINRLIKLGSA